MERDGELRRIIVVELFIAAAGVAVALIAVTAGLCQIGDFALKMWDRWQAHRDTSSQA